MCAMNTNQLIIACIVMQKMSNSLLEAENGGIIWHFMPCCEDLHVVQRIWQILCSVVSGGEGQIDDETQLLSFLLQQTHQIKRAKDF